MKLSVIIPSGVIKVIETLAAHEFEAFLVGGCVRDGLLGRETNDWDITTDARPEQVQELFDKVILTGVQHGTVTVVLGNEHYEVTTYRIDVGYSDGRRPDAVQYTTALNEDLARRDFTVNAIAYNPITNRLCDPYNGQADLARGLIRAVGQASHRLSEDGLRSFRAIRFACTLNFDIEATLADALATTHDAVRKVSVERIYIELRKTLCSGQAGRGLRLLHSTGLLSVGVPGFGRVKESEIISLTEKVDAIDNRWPMRFAAFASLFGEGAGAVCKALKASNLLRISVLKMQAVSLWDISLNRHSICGLLASAGRHHWRDALRLRAVLKPLDRPQIDSVLRLIEEHGLSELPLHPKELAVSGHEIMESLAIEPSKRVGQILDQLLSDVWHGHIQNSADSLLRQALDIHSSMGIPA